MEQHVALLAIAELACHADLVRGPALFVFICISLSKVNSDLMPAGLAGAGTSAFSLKPGGFSC